jgi:CBS domain-containing protein
MTNRNLLSIVKDQDPLVMDEGQSVQAACAAMCQRRAGSVLVVDQRRQLAGIFTGRDAVRVMSKGGDSARTSLARVMTENPVTISPRARAIDALRLMADGGFRHLPVVEDGRIWGIVSRGDFLGAEIDRLDLDEHLAECLW